MDTKWTVMAHNRVCSDATRIVEDDKAEQFLSANNPILNPDGSEWGQWEQVSLSGLTRQEAEAFCDSYGWTKIN